jgi:hypothetical protein
MKIKSIFFLCLLVGLAVTHLSAERGKKLIISVKTDGSSTTKSIDFLSGETQVSILDQGSISITPMQYDFGDVVIGTTVTTVVTATNIGDDDLCLSTIELAVKGDYEILTSVWPPYWLDPYDIFPEESSVDFEVSFTPHLEGYSSTELVFGSDDPVNPVMDIVLTGRGVNISPDVEQIQQELESSVIEGSIEGDIGNGNPNSNLAAKNLDHFRDILQAASDLYNAGMLEEACNKLHNADRRSDGLHNPPDFITGEDVWLINQMINALLDLWGCGD